MTRFEGYGHQRVPPHAVTILVTGFAEFEKGHPINPSSAIASLLPATLPLSPAYRTPVHIISHPYPIRVSYHDVQSLAPRLVEVYSDHVDIFLHIGAAPGASHYRLESQAHRDGYGKFEDVDGKTPKADKDAATQWPGCPPVLRTSLDFDDVYQRWEANLIRTPEISPELGGAKITRSDDAGHFICDFTYYAVLAELDRKARHMATSKKEQRPAIFLHVPDKSEPCDIRRGKAVVTTLIRALAESWAVHSNLDDLDDLDDSKDDDD